MHVENSKSVEPAGAGDVFELHFRYNKNQEKRLIYAANPQLPLVETTAKRFIGP